MRHQRRKYQDDPHANQKTALISAVGMLGSVAACAALAFGIWKLSAPELSFTEQNSEMSAISLEADTPR